MRVATPEAPGCKGCGVVCGRVNCPICVEQRVKCTKCQKGER